MDGKCGARGSRGLRAVGYLRDVDFYPALTVERYGTWHGVWIWAELDTQAHW